LDVARKITFFREQKGITVNKLANLAGVSQSFLREIELERKKPTVETLSLLCDALNVTLRDFFDDDAASLLRDDALMRQIYRLTAEQRERLRAFLELI